ncbi:TetR/AcrR family transcriptional regulator [Chelativorans sp. AA-79]|uniref:TetR/AcrR family transcriptional regulator n=1 Tax=Chelativorans sp. AA-79 TaxID=3028735 RepID=UPI0023FA0B8E|nr:TetR/AcrR family transcriptional regulator [Chelativorans sp. AA-79]WEX10743.1 TetR/AcrR family transcriptional regulator [Chelativorans sp. AA-79]
MSERAKAQEETRQRIVEATMHLHEEIGARATTISAIAEKAGVQRLTVYRHFPDETAVFQACTSHWLSLNPPPDPASWGSFDDPRRRFDAAVTAFYAYYASTRRMWVSSHRDVAEVPALQGPMAEFAGFVAKVAADLTGAFKIGENRAQKVEATVGHVLAFPTWDDLEQRNIPDSVKVGLAGSWLNGVLGS